MVADVGTAPCVLAGGDFVLAEPDPDADKTQVGMQLSSSPPSVHSQMFLFFPFLAISKVNKFISTPLIAYAVSQAATCAL